MAQPTRITLEDLLALNDEVAALVRAGVPLDQGLRSMSQEVPGRLGRFTALLSERLERGQSLEQTVGQMHESLPPVYCAVVAAGLRSGRLAAALEGISTTVRRAADLRRTVISAMVYPLIVLLVASLLLLVTLFETAPVLAEAYSGLGLVRPAWYEVMLRVAGTLPRVLPWFWGGLVLFLLAWLYRSSRAIYLTRSSMFRLPTIARVMHAGRMATFAEVLALMVEQDVPMDEAVFLSATASGDPLLARAGKVFAERVRSGAGEVDVPDFPPLLSWLLLRGMPQQRLVASLRRTAAVYRRKARHWGNWLGIYLPIFLSAAIGGAIALFYVLLVLAPFYNLLYDLSF